jgi:hypothetical protein
VAKLGAYYVRLLQRDQKLLQGHPNDCGCCAPCGEEQKPTEWRIIEVQTQSVYASGDITDLVMEDIPAVWTPYWYCRSPLYMALQVKCYDEWQVGFPVDEWIATIVRCAGEAGRYPEHDIQASYPSPCCTDQQTLTRGDPPGASAGPVVTIYNSSESCGDWEWTNLANWFGGVGPPLGQLPTAATSVTIQAGPLHTASLGTPTVNNLTVNAGVSFLVSIVVTGVAYLHTTIGEPKSGDFRGTSLADIAPCSTPLVLTGNVIAYAAGTVTGTVTGNFTQVEPQDGFMTNPRLTCLGTASFAEAGIANHLGTLNGLILNGASILYTGHNIVGPAVFNDTATFVGNIAANKLNCTATFNNSSINSGIISAAVTLNDSSQNQGSLTGTATFNGSSLNLGDVEPSAVFNGSSSNSKTTGAPPRTGRVKGDATFNGTNAINYSQVDGVATFNSGARNQGGSCGGAVFNGSSLNSNGGLTSPAPTTFSGPAIFNDQSVNFGFGSATFSGGVTFNGTANNNANSYGTAVFNSGATNQRVIYGNVTFNGSSSNLVGAIINGNAVFNGSSVNRGRVNGNATFNGSSSNFGVVTGTKTCNTTGVC